MAAILKVRLPDGTVVEIPAIVGPVGVGIKEIALKSSSETGNTYTVTMTDGKTYDFTSPRGPAGKDGDDGHTPEKGVDYVDGEDGVGIADVTLKSSDKTGNTYTITLTNNQTYDFVAPAGHSVALKPWR